MPNSAFAKFKLEGLDDIRNVLKTLPAELQSKVMSTAVKRAAAPLVDAAKMFAKRSERTGALRESIGAIVKNGKKGGVYAVVGPLRGYYRKGKKLAKDGDARGADQPANYAHLVEFGHRVAAGGKLTRTDRTRRKGPGRVAGFVAARPFMRPALLAANDAVGSEMAAGVADGIQKQLKRLVKNPTAPR